MTSEHILERSYLEKKECDKCRADGSHRKCSTSGNSAAAETHSSLAHCAQHHTRGSSRNSCPQGALAEVVLESSY